MRMGTQSSSALRGRALSAMGWLMLPPMVFLMKVRLCCFSGNDESLLGVMMLKSVNSESYTYRDFPVVGDGVEAFKTVKQTLLLTWEGNVKSVSSHPDKL